MGRGLKGLIAGVTSLGCMGVVGIGAVGVVGLAAVAGVAVYVIQSQWEETLRAAVVDPTGGEIDFESLGLGFNGVTVNGLVVRGSDGEPVLEAASVVAVGSPWSWTTERIGLQAAEMSGVKLSLRRSEADWVLPETTLDLALGDAGHGLPELSIPQLVVTDGVVEVTGPDGVLEARIENGVVGQVTAIAGTSLAFDRLAAETLALRGADRDELVLTGLSAEVVPGLEQTQLSQITIERASGSVDARGWQVPDRAIKALVGGNGIPWPDLAIDGIDVGGVDLRSGGEDGARVRARGAKVASASLTWGDALTVTTEPIEATNVTLLRAADDATVASTPWATVSVAEWRSDAARPRIPAVSTGPVTATLGKQRQGLGIPDRTWDLLKLGGVGSARIDRAAIESTVLTVETKTGTLAVTTGAVEAQGVAAPEALSIASATARTAVVKEGQRLVAKAQLVTLQTDGHLKIQGGEAWTSVRKDKTLLLPAGIRDHAPTWLGGVAEPGAEAWFGVSFDASPWKPKRLTATQITLHLRDAALVKPAVDWEMLLTRVSVGPLGSSLPISGGVRVADGTLMYEGALQSNGNLNIHAEGRAMKLVQFKDYARPTLKGFGLDVAGGKVRTDLDVRMTGSRMVITGDARIRKADLKGTNGTGKVLARAAAGVDNIDAPVEIRGDLADPEFSPMNQLVSSIIRGAIQSLDGEAVSTALDVGLDALQGSLGSGANGAAAGVRNGGAAADDELDKAREAVEDIGNLLGLGKNKSKSKGKSKGKGKGKGKRKAKAAPREHPANR